MRRSRPRFSPVEGVSDEDHVADAGLDGSFQPLDRFVDTTECDEGDHEVEVEGEFRAGPLQLLELGEVAQGLLRPARPREQVRSGAQAPHTSGRKRPVAQEFFDGPVVFFPVLPGLAELAHWWHTKSAVIWRCSEGVWLTGRVQMV